MIVNNKSNKKTRNRLTGFKNKVSNTFSFLNLPFNKLTIMHKTKNANPKKLTIRDFINQNLQNHNSNELKIGIKDINDLIDSKNCHLVAVFKDYLISDYIDEFLRRYYLNKEIKERLPKFEGYYKNYLTFFCKPTFSDFFANDIIQGYGEAKAEIYYNQNYGKKKKKDKINKEIAKTILDTLIRESIDNIENISNEKTESIIINKENTILLPNDETIIINGNKNSNESSISSILRCFSCQNNLSNEYKNDFKSICSSSMKRIKKLKNISLNNQNIKKGINTLKIQSNKTKSPISKFIPKSIIPTSSRLYSNNHIKDDKKNSKMTQIETSTSQNNLSNRTKNKSKDFSNSKVHQMASTMSNSNFSRNHIKIPINNKNVGIYLNNKIYLTSNSPIYSQRIRMKKSSKGKRINDNNNTTKIKSKKKNHLKKNSENIDLKDIMKLTLQAYDYKTRNKNSNILNNNIKHFHTLSSPTINNFNININNHICLNNNNLNSKKNKKSSFQGKKAINSRNKEQNLYKTNTDLEQNKNKNHSPNIHNYATNTTNDLESIMKNKFFLSLNGSGNDKLIKDINGLKSNRLFHHNLKIKNIYDNNKILSPKITMSPKGFFINKNLKNHMNSTKKENKISPPKTQKI